MVDTMNWNWLIVNKLVTFTFFTKKKSASVVLCRQLLLLVALNKKYMVKSDTYWHTPLNGFPIILIYCKKKKKNF